MRRVSRSLPFPLAGLFLGLLLTAGSVQTAGAQEPSFHLDQPVQSFEQVAATADSDPHLLKITTAWMEARADTEIQYSTYQKGVRILRDMHPEFYGNFFGDPFYATYDAEYFEMSRYRRIAGRTVNPFSGLSGMFFCNPTGYDPAFNGRCRGITFAALDFFFLPSGFESVTASTFMPLYPRSSTVCQPDLGPDPWCGSLYANRSSLPDRRKIVAPNRPDTLRQRPRTSSRMATLLRGNGKNVPTSRASTALTAEDLSSVNVTPVQAPDRPTHRIKLPDNVHTSIQTTVASLQRAERTLRLRQYIRQRYGSPQSLTPAERARLAMEHADRSSTNRGAAWIRTRTDDDLRPRRRSSAELRRSARSPSRSVPQPPRPTAEDSDSQTASATDRSETQRRKPKQRDPEKPKNR